MTASRFDADENLRAASWRDATLESVRAELATELGLSFEARASACVAASLAGELRLDARPARTCPQVFVLRTQGREASEPVASATADTARPADLARLREVARSPSIELLGPPPSFTLHQR